MPFHRYGHNNRHLVKVGDIVKKGQVIATIGKGDRNMFSAHLHWDIFKERPASWASFNIWTKKAVRDTYLDPKPYFKPEEGLPIDYSHKGYDFMQIAHYSRTGYHPGYDLNSFGGGDSDLDKPIRSVCDGVVVHDGVHKNWGKVLGIEETEAHEEVEERDEGIKEEDGPETIGHAGFKYYGPDMSHYQHDIDWNEVNKVVDFAIVKATEGNDANYNDAYFKRNQAEMRRLGMKSGFYHFYYPTDTDPEQSPELQAQHFLNVVGPLQEGEFLILDYERRHAKAVEFSKRFLDYVKEATGTTPLMYTYSSLAKEYDWTSITDYPLWIAAYGVNDGKYHEDYTPAIGEWNDWTMFQYTSSGSLAGTTGRIDLNVAKSLPIGHREPIVNPIPPIVNPDPPVTPQEPVQPIPTPEPVPVPKPEPKPPVHTYEPKKKNFLQVLFDIIIAIFKK